MDERIMNMNMNKLNVIAKVHLKTLVVAMLVCMLLLIPRVMAMSSEEVAAFNPYGLIAIFVGMGSAVAHFLRGKFIHLKRSFDVVVSIIALILTSPLIVIFSVLIKLFSPKGPVLYTQQRVGKDGVVFKIYKLRSMIPDAEKITGAVWCAGDEDPRMIPYVGSFLRKTHVDEIPQFLNVLMGDMSVVGPRPERPEIVESLKKQISEYEKRLMVKPGITGLAQIYHCYDRTLLDVKKKVKLDLLYIRKMCLVSEVAILLKTFVVVLKGKILNA